MSKTLTKGIHMPHWAKEGQISELGDTQKENDGIIAD